MALASLVTRSGVAETVQPEPARQLPLATQAVFLDLAAVGDRVVAVGERGIVVYADDRENWTQAQVPVRGTLTAVTFLDERTGFAVGHDAVILRTADAGATWTQVQFDPASQNVYLNVRFRTRDWGYIVGTNGQLLITRDGGDTWKAQTLSVEEWYQNHLFDIVWNGETTLVAAEKGVLYRSADGMGGWEPVDSPYEGSWFGAEAVSGGHVLLYGMSGRIYLSDSGGVQWTRVSAATQQFLYDAQRLDGGDVLVVGAGGVYGLVDVQAGTMRVHQRRNRVGLTAVLVVKDRAFLASEAGGVFALPLRELFPD